MTLVRTVASLAVGVGLVEHWHVADWCRKIQARSKLPELIRRLINETTGQVDGVVFPSDEGVDGGGFDGTVTESAGSVWVPQGSSVWELSTDGSPGTKADSDYSKRVLDPLGWDMAATSYVQVSLRPWEQRGAWAADRSAEGHWCEVRAIGFADIMAWLGDAPQTELWFAQLLRLLPAELSPGPVWWMEHLERTGGLCDESVILAGREVAASELRETLSEGASPVTVEADSVEDALEFIAATAIEPAAEDGGPPLVDRMVFVDGTGAWRRLHDEPGPRMLLVACEPALAELPGSERHTSVIAVQRHGGTHAAVRRRDGSREVVSVPRLDRRLVAEALDSDAARERGIDYQRAQQLGNEGHLSTAVLRRALTVDSTVRVPGWATNTAADIGLVRAKTAALLVGEWFADPFVESSPDMEVVAEIAGGGLDYEALAPCFSLLASDPDPMLNESGDEWELASAHEAWLLLAESLLDTRALNRIADAAVKVFGEADALAGLTTAERIAAQIQGRGRAYSMRLRRGLARTLALMATLGEEIAFGRGSDAASLAESITRRVLCGDSDEDASAIGRLRRLARLADVLPLLAEAAPDAFLEALESALSGSAPEIRAALFGSDEVPFEALSGSSLHNSVLWALERIAWLPDQLADIAGALLSLEETDPGGATANRNVNTFGGIYSAWAPQTSSAPARRVEILQELHAKVLSTMARPETLGAFARLLIATLPRPSSVVFATTRPSIRTYDMPIDGPSRAEVDAYVQDVAGLLVSVTTARVLDHSDPQALLDVIEAGGGITTATVLPEGVRYRLWWLFEQSPQFLAPHHVQAIARRLADLGRLHRTHMDAWWALPADEADQVSAVAASMTSQDLIAVRAWLFEQYDPPLEGGPGASDEFEAYDALLRQRRCEAVDAVLGAHGIGGVQRLAERAAQSPQAPPAWTIGEALAQALDANRSDGANDSYRAGEIESELLRSLDSTEASTQPAPSRPPVGQDVATGYFAGRFRRSHAAGDDAWEWLGGFLLSDRLTARQKALLIEAVRDHPRAWHEAASLGPDVEAEYWAAMNYFGMGTDFDYVEDVVVGLLSVDRFIDAAKLLTMYRNSESLAPQMRAELAVRALDGIDLDSVPKVQAAELANAARWLLDFLAETYPTSVESFADETQQRLYRLQVKYLWVRDPSKPIPFIYHRMALEPQAFVDLISFVFRRDSDRDSDTDPTAELPDEERERERNRRRAAIRILESWQLPPGSDESRAIDTDRLKNWISQAQDLLDIADRRQIGDRYIGRVLAFAPPDLDDGIAPPVPIRELLEAGQTEKLKSGLVSGIIRGRPELVGGLVTELAKQHRDAATRTRHNAEQIASAAPKTARLLRRTADAHDAMARSWESESDQYD